MAAVASMDKEKYILYFRTGTFFLWYLLFVKSELSNLLGTKDRQMWHVQDAEKYRACLILGPCAPTDDSHS